VVPTAGADGNVIVSGASTQAFAFPAIVPVMASAVTAAVVPPADTAVIPVISARTAGARQSLIITTRNHAKAIAGEARAQR
jgi:hypothetical protein